MGLYLYLPRFKCSPQWLIEQLRERCAISDAMCALHDMRVYLNLEAWRISCALQPTQYGFEPW